VPRKLDQLLNTTGGVEHRPLAVRAPDEGEADRESVDESEG
jgi:hypothetical protein